jgi:hypothetical protein
VHNLREKFLEAGKQPVGIPGFGGGQAAAALLGVEIVIVPVRNARVRGG